MSNAITLNGVSYLIPDVGEGGWGQAVTDYLVATSSGLLQKAGGTFTLTAQVDFGASFGLRSLYYTTRTANLASTGQFRMARADVINWRNEADAANLSLAVDSSDQLTFDGNPITSLALGAADTVLKMNTGGTATEYGFLANANIAAGAAIAVNKMAAHTVSRALVSDGSGFASPATTTATEIGYVNGVTSSIQTQLDGLATEALDNLASVAINTSLVSDTDNTDDLGTDAIEWKDVWAHSIKHNDATDTDLTITTTGNDGNIQLTPNGEGEVIVNGGQHNLFTAAANDTHALEVVCDAAGFADAKAIDIDYITGAIAATEEEGVILINIDESGSVSGSEVYGLEVLSTTLGAAEVYGLNVGVGVNPLEQHVGTFADMDSALVNATDRLTEFTSAGSDIEFFSADNDTITIGDAATFTSLEFDLAIVASQDCQITYEYSLGVASWATFGPVDGTNGMQNTGVIAWNTSSLPSWAVGTGSEYLIRMTRTRNGSITSPTENLVQIAASTEYLWDKSGNLSVASINASTDDSAAIDIVSTTKGFGLPNMTSTQRDAISTPKTGLKIWNTTTTAENVYDGSAWAASGGSGSGSGEINYITNGDAEVNTTGWATYDDGAVAAPVDGTGGSPTGLTLTAQATTILRGTQSFKLVKAGANHQGEGVSFDFTIDSADRNKLLKFADVYNTDGTYTDGDIAVFIYDVTNATLITPADNGFIGVDKDDSSSGSRTIGWASTDSLSYRAIFHITEATSNAYDLYFDDVIVGPGSVAITNEVAKTVFVDNTVLIIQTASSALSAPATSVNFASAMSYRDSNGEYWLRFAVGYNYTSAALSRFMFTGITLPAIAQSITGGDDGTNSLVTARQEGANNFLISLSGVATSVTASGEIKLSAKPDWFDANRDQSTVNLLSDNVAAANVSSKWKITDTSYTTTTTMDFDTVNSAYTNVGTWANTNGSITIPSDGKYTITCSTETSGANWTADKAIVARIGGTLRAYVGRASGSARGIKGSVELDLSKGDLLTLEVNESVTLTSDENQTFLSIVRQQDYSVGQPVGFGLATADTAGLVKDYPIVTQSLSGTDFNEDTGLTITGRLQMQRVGSNLLVTFGAYVNGTGTDTGSLALILPTYQGQTINVATGEYGGGSGTRFIASGDYRDETMYLEGNGSDSTVTFSRETAIGTPLIGTAFGAGLAGRWGSVGGSWLLTVDSWV